MTAFSNAEINEADVSLCWEIRSVNHRYLDISLYLPEGFGSQEGELKEVLRKKLGRGKVDARLVCKPLNNTQAGELGLNEVIVKSLLEARRKLEKISKKPMALSAMDVLQWPGAIETTGSDLSAYSKVAKSLFIYALDELVKSREQEGSRLNEMILSRSTTISGIIKAVRGRRPAVMAALREKVLKKLSEIDISADNNRLEQELVYQAQRLDIDEELDRLDSHVDEFIIVLKRDEPIGRRLDFLVQELNREANTLASKANDAETTKAAVELKVLIEQIREQCLNIE